MGLVANFIEDVQFLRIALKMKKAIADNAADKDRTAADMTEHWAASTPDAPALLFEDERYTYRELDEAANRYAHWARARGLKRGEVVALFMENRPDYMFAWLGLAKVGVVSALINTNLRSHALAHSLDVAGADHLILGAEMAEGYATAADQLEKPLTVWAQGGAVQGAEDLDAALAGTPADLIGREARDGMLGKDILFYIYTSGTTGLPKAARFPHSRYMQGSFGFAAATGSTARDRMYCVMPLYHSAAHMAVGNALSQGGSVALRRKFSAHAFWDDVVRYEATMFQYIGELCRYLLNTPHHPKEKAHRLRLAVGNGLRPDIWEEFTTRFAIPRVCEFYGSTEGNVTLFNPHGKTGAVGRIPSFLKKSYPTRLVRFDAESEAPWRGPDGFCVEAEPGEIGEALGLISDDPGSRFEGYTKKEETNKKILTDVFVTGDRYFRTGDLLRQDERGYFYFIDRIGDTFRWKGENVSTAEVSAAIGTFDGVLEANVYGVEVPGADGRAGMATLVMKGELDLERFAAHVEQELPKYARPMFIRVRQDMEVTGTFKHRKVELRDEGFDPTQIADPLYFFDPGAEAYEPLDEHRFHLICNGAIRL